MDLQEEFFEMRTGRRIRSRWVSSAGGIAFVAGAALAGQCMIWMGWFHPGETPHGEILEYWPGFLAGGVLLGLLTAIAARIFFDFYLTKD